MLISKINISIKLITIILVIIIGLIIFFYLQNNWISKTRLKVSQGLKNFEDLGLYTYQICITSLLKEQQYLIKQIKDEKPDIIIITGDLIDSRWHNEYIQRIYK